MARRRSGPDGWTTKTYKSPLWKYAHPVKYLRSQARTARRQMRPARVLGRAFSVPEIKRVLGTKTTRVNAQTRQGDVERAIRKTTAAQKKTAAKKTAKRADPYADALLIPGRNRQTAARQAKTAQPTAKKTVPVRRKDGKFDGRRTMRPDDLTSYERAQGGYVDPALRPRSARTRKRG